MESEDQDEEYKRLGGRIDEMLEERVERMVVDRL